MLEWRLLLPTRLSTKLSSIDHSELLYTYNSVPLSPCFHSRRPPSHGLLSSYLSQSHLHR